MRDKIPIIDDERDSLYILPLSNIPLEMAGLKKARLIKNPRLEGMVELFSGSNTGSGQIGPTGLYQMFDFDREPHPDVETIRKLSELPSYDVYSLRIQMRRMGIEVEDHDKLKLSDEKIGELSTYMRVFTRPLILAVYGHRDLGVLDFDNIISLFKNPDLGIAKKNIMNLSSSLKVDVNEIPEFLQNYGDVYLSLSYYQYCFDQNTPILADFYDSLESIRKDNHLKFNHAVVKACNRIEERIRTAQSDVAFVLEMFRARTEDMWEGISDKKFRTMEKLIRDYQTSIGAALCAITVKMNAWKKMFPYKGAGSLAKRVDYIVSEIGPGLETLQEIEYADA